MKIPPADHACLSTSELTDFAAIEVGRSYGCHRLELSESLVDAWCSVYGICREGGRMPVGMTSVISIRSFMALIPFRPPGGIHASQRFVIRELPSIGEVLHTTLVCARKAERGGRLWVDLEMQSAGQDGRPLFHGTHVALWAR